MPASISPWKPASAAASPSTPCCAKASPATASWPSTASSTAPATTCSRRWRSAATRSGPRARRSASAGLCRGRPQRRYRWLRRPLQAGAAGRPGFRREDHALRHLHGRHPPHLAAGLPVRAPVEAHHPPGLRRAQDSRRPDSLRAPRADPDLHHPGRRAGRLQRRLGEGQVRRGHVLLRLGRRRAAHGRGGGQRPDARGARDPQRQSRARLALRPRAPGRKQARVRHSCRSAPTTCASAWTTGPASSPNWPASWPARRSAWKPCCRSRATPSTTCRSSSPSKQTSEQSIREAVDEMSQLDFMREAPLALPMETAL